MPSYWSSFPDFDHNPHAPIKDEFKRLAELEDWIGEEQKAKYRREWGKCFKSEFEKHYGEDASSITGWQSLCSEVGLDVIPDTVQECKRVSYFPYRF